MMCLPDEEPEDIHFPYCMEALGGRVAPFEHAQRFALESVPPRVPPLALHVMGTVHKNTCLGSFSKAELIGAGWGKDENDIIRKLCGVCPDVMHIPPAGCAALYNKLCSGHKVPPLVDAQPPPGMTRRTTSRGPSRRARPNRNGSHAGGTHGRRGGAADGASSTS